MHGLLFISSFLYLEEVLQYHRMITSKRSMTFPMLQARWRGLLVRKNQVDTRQQLSNLRFRIKNSAVNVDDRLRLENRVTEALEVLLNHKTVSGILHTCATLGKS